MKKWFYKSPELNILGGFILASIFYGVLMLIGLIFPNMHIEVFLLGTFFFGDMSFLQSCFLGFLWICLFFVILCVPRKKLEGFKFWPVFRNGVIVGEVSMGYWIQFFRRFGFYEIKEDVFRVQAFEARLPEFKGTAQGKTSWSFGGGSAKFGAIPAGESQFNMDFYRFDNALNARLEFNSRCLELYAHSISLSPTSNSAILISNLNALIDEEKRSEIGMLSRIKKEYAFNLLNWNIPDRIEYDKETRVRENEQEDFNQKLSNMKTSLLYARKTFPKASDQFFLDILKGFDFNVPEHKVRSFRLAEGINFDKIFERLIN